MNTKHLTNQTITFEGDNGAIRKLTRFEQESSNDWNRRYHEACNELQGIAKRAKLFDGNNHDTINLG